jgi:hypothetical protein
VNSVLIASIRATSSPDHRPIRGVVPRCRPDDARGSRPCAPDGSRA